MVKKNRVVVAMSGGVDSSVTAYLLKQQGYEVIGATMNIWENKDLHGNLNKESFCSLNAVNDAKKVSEMLGIPHYVFDMRIPFKEKVIDYFINEYIKGKTPNPCVKCNKLIKFDDFLKKAMELNVEYMATGHYARLCYDNKTDRYIIRKAVDSNKDQTYVLYNLTQYQLSHILMPLGDYSKDKIREIARNIGLNVANKKDSQEICFIPQNNYKQFLKNEVSSKIIPGAILNTKGEKIGEHKGLAYYTIGQRKGLGLSLGTPVYVVDFDINNNALIIGEKYELKGKGLIADNLNFIPFDELKKTMKVTAKIRYNTPGKKAVIEPFNRNTVRVKFNTSEYAITPGQSVVFYVDDLLIGGGIISEKI